MTAKPADLFSLPMHRVAVVMVDFQNDFCSRDAGDGTSPPPNINNERPARLANHFAREAAELGAHVIYTRQVLDWDALADRQRRWESPADLCAVNSWGAELCLDPVRESVTVVKHRFDCWQSADFVRELDDRDIDGLIICGVELVGCVLYAILAAEERGYHYLVPTDLVSGRDTDDRTDNKGSGTTCATTSPNASPHQVSYWRTGVRSGNWAPVRDCGFEWSSQHLDLVRCCGREFRGAGGAVLGTAAGGCILHRGLSGCRRGLKAWVSMASGTESGKHHWPTTAAVGPLSVVGGTVTDRRSASREWQRSTNRSGRGSVTVDDQS